MPPALVDSPDFSLKHRVIRPTVESDKETPCVVLLHGIGSDENDLLDLGSRFGPEFLVISVRAPVEVAPGAYAWFKVRFTPAGPVFDEKEAFDSMRLVSNFLREIKTAYGIGKTVVAGFSQGGIMSACLALTKPEAVTGFAVLSGRIPSEIAPMTASDERLSQTKAFVSHGIRDEKLPLFH
ncbi:MAG: alpha/beta fold hydrolase [Patescibacteria group bacterium]